tara:strand:- start:415 stop:2856 length:2442 start_codon:yes stop_codon:yes gene_type:complete
MASSEIANDFVGTCFLIIEYYRALKRNIISNRLDKYPSRLRAFISKLKKSPPLIRHNGVKSSERKEIEAVMKQVHSLVTRELAKWMKSPERGSITDYIKEQIESHQKMISSIANMTAPVMKKRRALDDDEDEELDDLLLERKRRNRKRQQDYDDEESDSEEDEDYDDEVESEDEDEDEDDDGDDSEEDTDSEEDDSETEDERPRKKEKGPNKDLIKMKEYLHKRQKQSSYSIRTQLNSFEKMSKIDRKKILEQIENSDKGITKAPLIYRIMLSRVPENAKRDMISRLESLDKNEDECPKYREYVNAALKIPFGILTQSKVNYKSKRKEIKKFLQHTSKCMNDAVHGHELAKKQILQFVAQNITNPNPKGLVLGIEGPMGNGKTTLIEKGFSRALGRPFTTIPLGGVQDGSFLEGHGYTYEGSRWGQIVNTLMTAGCMNPIIYMDELDKVSRTNKGDEINNLLIHLIDPSQNHHFRDKYFADMDIDLSQCIFIFSYNDRDAINPVLMDRITHINTRGFRLPEKVVISKNFLLKNILEDVGIKEGKIEFDDNVLSWIIQNYTHEGGVRNLKKICYEIIREVNLRHLTTKTVKYPYKISREILETDILSKRLPYQYDKIHSVPSIGKINGLYATCNDTGGLVVVEAVWLPSDSELNLKLTGNQGVTMQESMHVAKTLSWKLLTKKMRNELKEQWKTGGKQGIHVHCPEGGVPKDGPSAGAAITTAIYSLMSGRKIKNDIAITGEIDLSGKIMPIGGLESKVFGAKTAGCKMVLCPKDNWNSLQQILEDHPDILDDTFQVKMVSNIDEVLKIMLVKK